MTHSHKCGSPTCKWRPPAPAPDEGPLELDKGRVCTHIDADAFRAKVRKIGGVEAKRRLEAFINAPDEGASEPTEFSTPLAATWLKMLSAQRESFERTRPLCPDHRDKQRGSECMACKVERLETFIRSRAEWMHNNRVKAPFHDEHGFSWDSCNSLFCVHARAALSAQPVEEKHNITMETQDDD